MAELRAVVPRVVARVATAIQAEVEDYAGPLSGDRRRLIEATVSAGLRGLADRASGTGRPDTGVDDLFRHIGRAEALDGETLEAMRAACDIATREGWRELRRIAIGQGQPVAVLGLLGDALFEQMDHLRQEVERGYRAGTAELMADLTLARQLLGRQLLAGADEAELRRLAERARWALPEVVLVLGVDTEQVTLAGETDALVLAEPSHAIVLCDVGERDDVLATLRGAAGPGPVIVSLPVAPTEVADAARMVARAHRLVEDGVIAATQVVDCADVELPLWLHAEPLLRKRLTKRLLGPLDDVTPHRRKLLALTLVAWLEHGGSAPAAARQLGVHPQTVRYRIRQLETLFGDRMQDPREAFPMLMTLKATLPDWSR